MEPRLIGTAAVWAGVPKWLKAIVAMVWAFFAPVAGVFWATLGLVVLDMVTGVWAAKKVGEPITSSRLGRSARKLTVYFTGIAAAHMAGVHLLDGAAILGVDPVKALSGIIGAVELLSVMENLNRIQGGSMFRGLITRLGSSNAPESRLHDKTGQNTGPIPTKEI